MNMIPVPNNQETDDFIGSREVQLRSVQPSDLQCLARIRSDVEAQHLLMAHPEASAGSVADWVERRTTDRHGAFYIVATRISDEPLGFIQLTGIHGIDRHASLGIALDRHHWGRGMAGIAIRRLLMKSEDGLGLCKLMLQVRCDNHRAIRLYESLEFRQVGLLSQNYWDGTQWHDALIYEKLLARSS